MVVGCQREAARNRVPQVVGVAAQEKGRKESELPQHWFEEKNQRGEEEVRGKEDLQ
jgi:hypothetical protein